MSHVGVTQTCHRVDERPVLKLADELDRGEEPRASRDGAGDGRLWVRLPAVLMNINAKAKEVLDRYEMAAIAGAIRVISPAA
jgi:hypothetical protein